MVVKRCAYGECKSDSRYFNRDYMHGVNFVRFPKPKTQLEKCQRWIKACSRGDNFGIHSIKPYTYICSLHFVGGKGPTDDHPDPIPATARGVELRIFENKKKRQSLRERLNCRPTPTTENRRETLTPSTTLSCGNDVPDPDFVGKECVAPDIDVIENTPPVVPEKPNTETENRNVTEIMTTHQGKKRKTCEASTQTTVSSYHIEMYSDTMLMDQKLMKRNLFMKDVLRDDNACKFYTGLVSIQVLLYLFNVVKDKAEKVMLRGRENTHTNQTTHDRKTRMLSTFEAFVLVLVRLRRGMDMEHLADNFGTSSTTVSRYCVTWIDFLSKELSFLIKWPARDQIRSSLTNTFRHYKATSAIIDCTEFFIQKPSLPSSQRITWSSYKHHNTLKTLIAISPTGAFTFVSDLWSGSISDRKIVQACGFLEKIQQGDDVMADRGFLIRDLLALRGATLNIPPFAHGKQLSSAAVTKTRRIASARIHVERAIGRLKNFKILQGTFPLKSKDTLNQTVQLCAQLCNIDSVLVK
ncbi:uncharacterized protein LOC144448593 [Glandiceps talaboti]